MKKKIILILILMILCLNLSACAIFESYLSLKSFSKVLANDGYSLISNDELNNYVDNFIYSYKEDGNTYISKRGSIIEEDTNLKLYTPSAREIKIYKSGEVLLSYNDFIIKSDLKTYEDDIEINQDIIKVYKYDNAYVILVDDMYLYALNIERNQLYVSDELKETFYYKKERLHVECKDIIDTLNIELVNNYLYFNDCADLYFKQNPDSINIYLVDYLPSNLNLLYYKKYEVDKSYLDDIDNHKIWYMLSNNNDILLKVEYRIIGKENLKSTLITLYNIKEMKARYGRLTEDNNWNDEVKEKLNKLNIDIPFYKMGYAYEMNDQLSKNNFSEDFCKLCKNAYKIYDHYYMPILDGYKEALEENGFILYETPVDLVQKEGQSYTEYKTAINTWLNSGEDIYFDTYINEEKGIFVKLTYSYEYGNIIEIYLLNE